MLLIVSSNKDIASLNIANQILQHYPFQKTSEKFQDNPIYTAEFNQKTVTLIRLNEESVNAQKLPENFPNAALSITVVNVVCSSGATLQ